MLPVYFRIFAKLGMFVFGLFFIVFFVVYGYRYDRNVGFIQKNVYVEFKFWGESQNITVNGQKYFAEDKSLKLYNIENGCYNIQFNGEKYNKCLGENESFYDVFVEFGGVKNLGKKLYQTFDKVSFVYFRDNSINKRVFSTDIQNVFVYNNINFVQTDNKLFCCTETYSICKYLSDVNGDVFGGNKKGLLYLDKDGNYNLVSLK